MIKARIIVIALLLIGIVFGEYGFIENTPEKKYEAAYTDITKIPASSVLPQYLGSLFLGAFRAAAIDVLWVNYGEEKDAHRYYEAKEIVELISYLQPHNEIVWDFLAWDVAYNLSHGEMYFTLDQWWKWVKYGLMKLREGSTFIKNSPYLKYEIGWSLEQKTYYPSLNGLLDMNFVRQVENDSELQEALTDGEKGTKYSPLELSIMWMEKAKKDLEEYENQTKSKYFVANRGILYYTVPGGLIINKERADAYIRDALYYQAVLCWQRGDYKRAAEWLDKAIAHGQMMVDIYNMGGSDFSKKYVKFYKQLRDAMPAVEHAFATGTRDEKIKALGLLEQFMVDNGAFDEGFVCRMASLYKKSLGADEYEYNDIMEYATVIKVGQKISATIAPTIQDVDFYVFGVDNPDRIKISVSSPPELSLSISILDSSKKEVQSNKLVNDNLAIITFSAQANAPYYIKIFTPADGKWSPTAKYELEVTGGK